MNTDEVRTVEFRDTVSVFLTGIVRPTFLYDRKAKIRHKFGEFEHVEVLYLAWREAYIAGGFQWMADDLAIVELAPDQEEIDRLFQSSGAFERFVDKLEAIGNSINK
jgi:hypothetical protein